MNKRRSRPCFINRIESIGAETRVSEVYLHIVREHYHIIFMFVPIYYLHVCVYVQFLLSTVRRR